MADINKPDMQALWAEQGAIIAPSDTKVRGGWTAEVPPNQWENWVQNRQDRGIAYLMQKGLPEWDATSEYIANKSFVQHNGIMYKSSANSVGQQPSSSSSFWTPVTGDFASTTYVDSQIASVNTALNQKASSSLVLTAGTGLTGGGNLSQNRTFNVSYGTTAGTAAQGNDTRITGAAQKSANLSDLASVATARTNLGLGAVATMEVGTTSGTVAQGNDSRITGALQATNNLSDIQSVSVARSSLGLGNSATRDVGTSSSAVAAGNDSRITGAAQKSSNLNDLTNKTTARNNLGLGTAATSNITASTSAPSGGSNGDIWLRYE